MKSSPFTKVFSAPENSLQTVELPYSGEEVRAEHARRSLREYIREAWHVVEPSTPYVHGWHIDAICEHLEAISAGEIKNLVVNVPPRHQKSLTVSVFWPTWEWINRPELRYIYSAYGQDLSVRDALKSRRLILSPWYQEHYGDRFSLTSDQNQKTRYDNDKTGYRIATGVGGMATGEGGDRLILDDPHKLADTHSDPAREEAIRFWNETMSTRGNDPKTVAKVVIMQRVHERDVTGDIIEQMEQGGESYEMLVLPAEYERSPQLYVSSLDWSDPREEPGELLWPERFSTEAISNLKVSLGDSAAGQLQQRPAPIGGAIFQRDWWRNQNRFDPTDPRLPRKSLGRFAAFDTANKDDKENAYTVGVVADLMEDYSLNIVDVQRGKPMFPDLPEWTLEVLRPHMQDLKLKGVWIEEAASGLQLLQVFGRTAPAWLRNILWASRPVKSKEDRWRSAALWCKRGGVKLPHPSPAVPWLYEFERELFNVPNSKFLDQADALSMLINELEVGQGLMSEGWTARTSSVSSVA